MNKKDITKSLKSVNVLEEKTLNYIDFTKVDSSTPLSFDIVENSFVYLSLRGNCSSDITFNVKENSTLILNILFDTQINSKVKFALDDNATINVSGCDLISSNRDFHLTCDLKGINSKGEFHLACLSSANDNKVFDVNFNHLNINTGSIMENYGISKDHSSLSFVGNSFIQRGSKKANARQITKIVAFDEGVKVKASPILSIDENDVIASHGASEGQVNQDHIFYLMSRGLSEEEAKKIIILGYLSPIINYFIDDDMKQEISSHLDRGI